jgi:hypothetical protein
MVMDDRMRASDADREAVTAKLRDHFAEGRLTQTELDERVTAALGAKTYGDLRPLTVDLPGPAPVPPRTAAPPQWAVQRWGGPPRARRHRHHPPVGLFLLLAMLVLLASGGGWVVFGFFRLIMLFWLVTILVRVGFGLAGRNRRRWM